MTYLQIVNRVLRRLRQDQASSVSGSAYTSLVAELVNEAKREVEDAHEWQVLESSVMISTVAATDSYTLTGFGQRSSIQSVLNATNKGEIRSIDTRRFERLDNFSDLADGLPDYWRLNGQDPNDDPIIQFLPAPGGTYTINVYGIVPQDDLLNDGDTLMVPYWPVVLGAYALAVSERGDDRGAGMDKAQAAYQTALADAIATDSQNNYQGRLTDWYLHPTPTVSHR